MRFAQGKLREGSPSLGAEMLRCAQHDRGVMLPRQRSAFREIDASWETLVVALLGCRYVYPFLISHLSIFPSGSNRRIPIFSSTLIEPKLSSRQAAVITLIPFS